MAAGRARWAKICLALAFGIMATLCVRGYRFGESNHAVYLLAAVQQTEPGTLANDWWTQSTLQYHFAFNSITAALMKAGIIEPVFLVGYLALVVLFHVGWYRLVLALRGDWITYVVSLILFYLLAGGLALGHYHVLQDSSFLPSNISNVAMLWGLLFWIRRRLIASGLCLGIAGLFHINHALGAIGMWIALPLTSLWCRRPPCDSDTNAGETPAPQSSKWRALIGTLLLLALCSVAIIPAVRTVLARSGSLPLDEFVKLFVRLRHPHHFDPLSWHWALWACFLLPIPFALMQIRHGTDRRAVQVAAVLSLMTLFALLTAGFWFVSETFVQLNLYRFTIYLKLLTCIWAAQFLVSKFSPLHSEAVMTGVAAGGLCVAVAGLITLQGGGVIIAAIRADPPEYVALADWARQNTPRDAVFIVPPQESSFRLHARRAIVVNFKNVPQLSAELPEWRDRLNAVLDMPDVTALPAGMGPALKAMGERYDEVSPDSLAKTARRYRAQYIVTRRALNAPFARMYESGGYFLYHLPPEGSPW